MQRAFVLAVVAACGSPAANPPVDDIDAAVSIDAADIDAPSGVPLPGFGELAGMCGVLATAELTSASPLLVRDTFTFARGYADPADRPLLTAGGLRLAETPNAGGSSGMSEIFAFEQLARCELAALIKTETEIVYETPGKITDILVRVDELKIGVSVVRAQMFPLGDPYTSEEATRILTKKLGDIQLSTANVSDDDRWVKQILAVLAYDDQAANMIADTWAGLDAGLRADTIVIVSSTAGDDLFIYTE